MAQLHKKFTYSQIEELIEGYLKMETKIIMFWRSWALREADFSCLSNAKNAQINSQFSMVEKFKQDRFRINAAFSLQDSEYRSFL